MVEAEDMPAVAANSLSIAFGDFSAGYMIVDRIGLSVLRDPYSNNPYVTFHAVRRVGGGVVDAGDLLLGPTRRSFADALAQRSRLPVAEVRPAELGNTAGVIGAADLARRR